MSGPSPSLRAWRAAEAAIGRDVAAPPLPTPRLFALRDALDALDAGDAARVDAIATAAQRDHPDLAALLHTLRGRLPAALDAVPETVELPLRDLLVALDAARAGQPATLSARLELAGGYRPVLHALTRLVSDDRADVFANPVLAAFSPRADQLQLAARAAQVTGTASRGRLLPYTTEDGLALHPDRWPDLEASRAPGDLAWWWATRIAWNADHDDTVARHLAALEGPDRAATLPEARRALGGLLFRLDRDVRLGRLAGLAPAARAAFSLAWALGDEAGDGEPRDLSALREQLGLLQLRVERFDPEHPGLAPLLLVHLFRHRGHLPPYEAVHVARAVLREAGGAAPDEVRHEAATLLMARSPDSEEAGEVLFLHAVRLPPGPLLQRLEATGAEPLRRVHLAGIHAASGGWFPQALGAARRLAAEARPDAVAVTQILRTLAGALARQPEALTRLRPTLAEAWSALCATALPMGAWGPVVALPELADTVPDDARAALAALADRTLHAESAPADARVAAVLALAWLRGPDAARQALTLQGRALRRLDLANAARDALTQLAWAFTWNASAARAHVDGLLRPLSSLARQQGGALLPDALRALAEVGAAGAPTLGTPPHLSGAIDWWLYAARAEADGPAFRQHLRSLLSVPSDLVPLLHEVAETADLTGVSSLPEAAQRLAQLMQARLDLQGGA
jgi:hypothetical protein